MYGLGLPELVVLLALCIPGIIAAMIAHRKGRNAGVWFVLGAVFWISIIVIMVMRPLKPVPGRFRECPICKEIVKWDARVCRGCKTELPPMVV